jgi:hypothetical protein
LKIAYEPNQCQHQQPNAIRTHLEDLLRSQIFNEIVYHLGQVLDLCFLLELEKMVFPIALLQELRKLLDHVASWLRGRIPFHEGIEL